MPSLKQLNDAIASYRSDHPEALITVVVDATFGHRIDSKEVPEFEKAIETNELVAPPAGAVGRGDGFVLSIAQKAHASVISNDSYQEFHGEYPWLFDEGRLIGGKPVPHVGWVFVDRVPVRGPVSRRSVKEQKVVDKNPSRSRSRGKSSASLSADGPMPVPKSPPPGAVMPSGKSDKVDARQQSRQSESRQSESRPSDGRQPEQKSTAPKSTNDLLAFLSFVEHFPVGTAVTAVVENYSSHGAYVSIGDVKGYVPLRLMSDPPPRSAREAMEIGETVTLVVASFAAARRSIDLALPSMAPAAPPPAEVKPRRAAARKAVVAELTTAGNPPADVVQPAVEPKKAARGARKASTTKQPAAAASATDSTAPLTSATAASIDAAGLPSDTKKGRGATKRQPAKAAAKAPAAAATATDEPLAPKQAKQAARRTAKKAAAAPASASASAPATEQPSPRAGEKSAAKKAAAPRRRATSATKE